MINPLRERLISYLNSPATHIPVARPIHAVTTINAASLAEALLPFIRDELEERAQEFRCISCGGLDPRCDAYHPEYGFTCILPKPHSGPHWDTAGGHWDTRGQLDMDATRWHEGQRVLILGREAGTVQKVIPRQLVVELDAAPGNPNPFSETVVSPLDRS